MRHALIVEPSADARGWTSDLLLAEGFTVVAVDTMGAARAALARRPPDLLLVEPVLPDGDGTQLARELDASHPTLVVVMTAHPSLESAVAALRIGAADYLTQPIDSHRLRALIRRIERRVGPAREPDASDDTLHRQQDAARRDGRFGRLIGASAPMQALYDRLARVAPTAATVLLVGESGTGKELAAQTLHELSRRRRFPFLPINCGAISPNLVESELFGHEKGSFTGAERQHAGVFEQARGGTVFLDEVTEMPLDLQVKLLRVLETGSFTRVGSTDPIAADVRIVAATNRDPVAAVAAGRFRDDLYHRLNVFPIELPPLRERGADIERLAQAFLADFNRAERTSKRFSPQALGQLYERTWPGNVRQLRNAVQRACILGDDSIDFDDPGDAVTPSDGGATGGVVVIRVGTPLDEVERRVTLATLAQCGQVKRAAARVLGISLKTLYNRLDGYALAEGRAAGGGAQGD